MIIFYDSMIKDIKLNLIKYAEVYLSLLMMLSHHFLQSSHGQSCNTMLPANSQTILDSNTYHTTDTAGQTHPFDINGWIRIDVDGTIYDPPDSIRYTYELCTATIFHFNTEKFDLIVQHKKNKFPSFELVV